MNIDAAAEWLGYTPDAIREAMSDMGMSGDLTADDMSDIAALIDIASGVPIVIQ